MVKSSFDKLFTKDRLRSAFDDLWKAKGGRGASGVDFVSPSDFKRHIERNLDRLTHNLQTGYNFSALRPFTVPKATGKGDRLICVPTVGDRVVQRLIIFHLMSSPGASRLLNGASFGFIKGRGVAAARDRAIALRAQHSWAYKSDISSFFDNIPRIQLLTAASKIFRQPSMDKILHAAAHCEIGSSNEAVKRLISKQGIVPGHGVRHGMPISPLFSNVILVDFDREMLKSGFNIVRYADDFIVLADNNDECIRADSRARELLKPLKLELPPISGDGKTQILSSEQPVEFLGLSLQHSNNGSYVLNIAEKQLEKIQSNLSCLNDPDHLFSKQIRLHEVVSSVLSSAQGYRVAYAAAGNLKRLEEILKFAQETTLRALYERAFCQKNVATLSNKLQAILGLTNFPDKRTP